MKTLPIASAIDRFWSRVEKTDTCWLWMGCLASNGYGFFKYDYRQMRAHRFAWQITYGPVPKNMLVCHKCDVRRCVNPEHLFIGTQLDNIHDMLKKGRERPWGRTVTHCPRGHEYTDENTYTTGTSRQCRTCVLASLRARRLQQRACAKASNE